MSDVGGTSARFALCRPGEVPTDEIKVAVADHAGFIEAAESYLHGRTRPTDAIVAVAGRVAGDTVTFTNSAWRFSIREAEQRLGLVRLTVINDLVAQAMAIALLQADDLSAIKSGTRVREAPAVVIGPGTGLGVAFLWTQGGRIHAIPSEAGHTSFTPQNETETAILGELRREHGHVSAERLLSGPGLVSVTQVLARLRGVSLSSLTPQEVSARARNASCPTCVQAMQVFSAVLGATAGNLALTILATGGVFLTGGLCRGLRSSLDIAALSAAFTDKGRFAPFLETVAIDQVVRPHLGLLGASAFEHPS